MSAKWSVQPVKGTLADADVFLIIDSEAGPVDNKQVLFSTLALAAQTPWRGDIDAATFNLDNLTSVDLNNTLGTNPIIFALQSASESTVVFGSNFQLSSGFIDISEIATPSNPATDVGRLYVQDDGGITTLFFRDSTGTITDLVSGGGGGHVIEDEGTPLTQRANLNFVGNGVNVTDNDPDTLVTINAYSAIFDEGTGPLTQRSEINFAGAGVTVTDDIGNQQTLVTIPGGGSSPTLALGDMIARGAAVDERVPIGVDGQVLKVSAVPSNLVRWETLFYQSVEDEGSGIANQNILNFVGLGVTVADIGGKTTVTIPGGADVLTTKGDLLSFDTIPNRLPVGSDGQVLEADSGEALGVKWGVAGTGHVIEEEGTPLVQRANLNFAGPGVFVSDANPDTLVTVKGFTGQNVGTGLGEVFKTVIPTDFVQFRSLLAGTNITITNLTDDIQFDVSNIYSTIEDAGTPVAQEDTLNFTGAGVTVSAGAGETIVDITGSAAVTTTQGDIIGRGLTTDVRVPIGSVGQVLTVGTVPNALLEWTTQEGRGYFQVRDEGTPLDERSVIDFEGDGVVAADGAANITTVTIDGGPLTTKGDIFTFDTVFARLPVGTDTQFLTADSVEATGLKWVDLPIAYRTVQDEGTPIIQRDTIDFVGAGVLVTDVASVTTVTIGGAASPLTTKGDVFGFDTGDARIPVGTDGQVLTANSAIGLGLEWATPAAVTSPLTTLGDLYGFSTVDARIPVGSPGQHLTVLTAQPTSIGWSTPSGSGYDTIEDEGVAVAQENIIDFVGAGVTATAGTGETVVTIPGFSSPLTTQGDLFARNLTVDARLPIGTPNQVLAVSTVTPTLMNWVTLATNFYQTVQDEGVAEIQRSTINFVGAGVTVSDVASVTTVTIAGGGGSPLTTKGDIFTFDTVDARLPVGTNAQVLAADSVEATGLNWVDAFATPLTTQGDIFGRDATGDQRVPIGSPGQVLTVQTAQPTQVNWVTPAPASPVSVIGHVDVVTPTNSVSVVLTETINFDDTVTDIELVGSFSLAVADTVRYFINSLSQTAYSSTFVFVSNTGTVTGQNTANASVGWSTGKSFAAGLSAAVKLRLNIGDSISLNSRPTGEIWETPGDTTGDLYRAGRVNYVATPAPTSITSIQITTAGTQNFEAGSSFTVIKRTTS